MAQIFSRIVSGFSQAPHQFQLVANYCDQIHLALAEEVENIKNNSNVGIIGGNQQVQWEKAFTSCYHKVDDEIGGKSVRGIIKGDENASIARFEPVAPETVGSTAGYRWSVRPTS